MLVNANSQAISWRKQVNFQKDDDDDDEVCLVLYLYASCLKQQSTDRHIALPGHIIFIPSQPIFALFP